MKGRQKRTRLYEAGYVSGLHGSGREALRVSSHAAIDEVFTQRHLVSSPTAVDAPARESSTAE